MIARRRNLAKQMMPWRAKRSKARLSHRQTNKRGRAGDTKDAQNGKIQFQ
jgi:hypothetical protein